MGLRMADLHQESRARLVAVTSLIRAARDDIRSRLWNTKRASRFRRCRGDAVLETALMAPWIFFVFAGALDMGFYTHALIATEEAARSAVEYTSKNATSLADSAGACQYALTQLRAMSNVRGLTGCSSSPLVVTATAVIDADGYSGSLVSVGYTSDNFIPIPGVTGHLTVVRSVRMMMR